MDAQVARERREDASHCERDGLNCHRREGDGNAVRLPFTGKTMAGVGGTATVFRMDGLRGRRVCRTSRALCRWRRHWEAVGMQQRTERTRPKTEQSDDQCERATYAIVHRTRGHHTILTQPWTAGSRAETLTVYHSPSDCTRDERKNFIPKSRLKDTRFRPNQKRNTVKYGEFYERFRPFSCFHHNYSDSTSCGFETSRPGVIPCAPGVFSDEKSSVDKGHQLQFHE